VSAESAEGVGESVSLGEHETASIPTAQHDAAGGGSEIDGGAVEGGGFF